MMELEIVRPRSDAPFMPVGIIPGLDLAPPDPRLQVCIVVPVRDEQDQLPALLRALTVQQDLAGGPLAANSYEVVLLLNNCSDGSARVARDWQRRWPRLRLHVVEIQLAAHEAHVGRARQIAFDVAHARFAALGRPAGLILTTDADTEPAVDWVAQTRHVLASSGVDGVGGRIHIKPAEYARLAPGVRRLYLLDIGYRRALEQMRHLYAPDEHDPFPRHHQHYGGSLAVTAGAYRRAGGMPLVRSSEDVALFMAVLQTGGRFRHSYRVRTYTSARTVGRAFGGLADAMAWWHAQDRARAAVQVESAGHAQARLHRLGLWRLAHPHGPQPHELLCTPEPTAAGARAELGHTLNELRRRNTVLAGLLLARRLAEGTPP